MSDNGSESLLFPQGQMKILMEGFEELKKDYKNGSFVFLNSAVKDGELISQDLILAAAPLRFHQLLFRSIQISPLYKQFRRSWFKSLLSKNGRAEDWPWAFALAAQYCAFGNPPQILKAFNTLCKRLHYSGQVNQISDLAQKKMEMLKEEVLRMDPNGFYFDFTSQNQQVILPPLPREDIEWLFAMAKCLSADHMRRYLIQSETDALKILRLYGCVMNGHIKGYEDIPVDAAKSLLTQSMIVFKPTSSYLICEWFIAFCCEGRGATTLGFFLEHKEILTRPMQYRTIFRQRPNDIYNYIDFIANTPSRRCEGIAWSLRRGHQAVLYEFLGEKQTRRIVDTKHFVLDLCELLGSDATAIAIEVYRAQGSKHIHILETHLQEALEREVPTALRSEDYAFRFDEEILIRSKLGGWNSYYDDRNVLTGVLSRPEPEFHQAHRLIMRMGYCHDLECAKMAVQTRKESYDLLDSKLQKHPEILKLVKEDT